MAEKIIVGCKLPCGLWLNPPLSMPNALPVELRGANSAGVIGGFGLTEGVDADFFAAWLQEHKGKKGLGEAIDLGLVFAQPKPEKAAAVADERSDVRSGFEGMNPDAPGLNVTRADA